MSNCGDCKSGCNPIAEGVDLSGLVPVEEPELWEFATNDSVFIKQMFLRHAGTIVPQHSHAYAHSSLLAVGSVRLWKDGVLAGDHTAPTILSIDPGVKHLFQTLVDNTIVYCIHNLSRSGMVEILEEHNLLGDN
jgi:hypothetical protein